mmetsp:Transcript_4208/g.10142  ORF Transcript_4208/g.10142 Transcript_4208/m.10142 type:complete len:425 (+) Transcript_4208:149-1423(+)
MDEGTKHQGSSPLFAIFCLSLLVLFLVPYSIYQLCCGAENEKTHKAWAKSGKTKSSLSKALRGSCTRGKIIMLLLWGAVAGLLFYIQTSQKEIAPFDPFAIMELSPDATEKEVKKQYYKLAKERHPDKNPDDPQAAEKFDLLAKAYNALTDETARENYKKYGHPDGPQVGSPAAPPGIGHSGALGSMPRRPQSILLAQPAHPLFGSPSAPPPILNAVPRCAVLLTGVHAGHEHRGRHALLPLQPGQADGPHHAPRARGHWHPPAARRRCVLPHPQQQVRGPQPGAARDPRPVADAPQVRHQGVAGPEANPRHARRREGVHRHAGAFDPSNGPRGAQEARDAVQPRAQGAQAGLLEAEGVHRQGAHAADCLHGAGRGRDPRDPEARSEDDLAAIPFAPGGADERGRLPPQAVLPLRLDVPCGRGR